MGSNLIQISSDSFTVGPGQHATEVEPHMLSNGATMVAAFQVGRLPKNSGVGGGGTDIGWATSTDGGATWTHGSLPGLTTGEGSGPYDAGSDPAVAWDAKHGVWLISVLPLSVTLQVPAVVVTRSTDGVNWGNPVSVDPNAPSSDKNWIVCDSWPTSPHYGNCYLEWDDPIAFDEIVMSTSTDGGLTWSAPTTTSDAADGIGGQPLVQPNGNVIVPIESTANPEMMAYLSTNGGASWGAPVPIASIQYHADAGGIRSGPLPSAAVDSAGNIWVVWEDCRFRATPKNCATNDLVYSTSSDGVNWSPVARIPIDDVTSSADYFIPGIGIDPATSGASAHVAVHYYYYSQTSCDVSSCQLFVGYISSANGGSTWNAPATLTAAPMELSWLPTSQNGLMVGDYIATAFVNGVPSGVFAVAQQTSGGNKGGTLTFSEAIYTGTGLSVKMTAQQRSSAHDKPMHKVSDKIERETPEKGIIPPTRRRAKRSSK